MNEVKNPKKPLVYYYAIVILVILALNFLAVPWLSQRQVKEVDYGTFMTMTENQEIGRVEVQNNQILFTNKDDTQVYKTGLMDDPDLIYRLKDSGAEFSSEIVEQMSPFLSFLLTWLLPIVFFVALGQFMLKRMTSKAGGPNSMMFGLGGSNAKVYVKSAEGIKFSDDDPRESRPRHPAVGHDAPQRRHRHRALRKRRALYQRHGQRGDVCQRLHPLYRRRRVRPRLRDGHLHAEAPRPRPHGARRAEYL